MMGSLTGLTQESLIALLLYDREQGGRVCSLVPIECYDGPYRRIASEAVNYWRQFNEPPGEHALDIFAAVELADPKKAELSRRLFESIQECRENINPKYVLGQAEGFVREQRFRKGIVEAVGLLEQGKLDDAQATVQESMKEGLRLFHSGLVFSETPPSDLTHDEVEALPTGIKELDEKELGPAVGELNLLIAPSNYGKSWWLNQLGKAAVTIAHASTLYVTLEMGERKVARRFLQSFCAVSKRRERIVNRVFEEDEQGRFVGISSEVLEKVGSLSDADVIQKLAGKHANFRRRSPLVIRQFPTGSLTVRELTAYLDALESQSRFKPKLMLLDYPDLMHVGDRSEHRISLGKIFQELRGLAISRQMAVAVVSQTNRMALGKKLITEKDVAEDYSKIATADVAFSYNQTEAERRLGLARLHVMKARGEEKGFTVLISQNYATGQFCISSTRMMPGRYWKAVEDGDVSERPVKRREML
jgi:hypothetical protein